MKCPTCGLELGQPTPRVSLLSCPRCGRPLESLEQHPSRYQPRSAANSPGVPHFTLPVHAVTNRQLARPEDLSRSRARPGLLREPPYPDTRTPASNRAPVILTMLSIVILLALLLGAALLLRSTLGEKAARASVPENRKSPTVGTVSTATTTPVGAVIYQSSLEGAAGGWANGTHYGSQADGYHISGNYLCYAPVTQQGNVDISVTVKQVSGSSTLLYGIVFRASGKGDYYVFGVDSNGKWTFAKLSNNTRTYLIPPKANAAIKAKLNESNTLEVKATGSQFAFYVNGIQVGHATDTAYATGLIGLTSGSEVEVVYTNIRIAQLKS